MPHPLLTSREQDMAASKTHQALMNALGTPLLKSQVHHDALQVHLRRDNNQDHRAPANPAETIRRSSPDVLLTPLQRAKADIERRRKERAQAARRTDAGDTDDEEIGEDGHPVSKQGCSLSKSLKVGAFERLRTGLKKHQAEMLKSIAAVDIAGESFEQRYGVAAHAHVAHAIEPVRVATVRAVAKPVTMAGVTKRMATLAKSLGNTELAKSLEAGTNSESATLTGGSAMRRQSLPVSNKPKQITAAQVEAACMKGLASGAISGGEAAHICTALTMGHPLGGDLMLKVCAIHNGMK